MHCVLQMCMCNGHNYVSTKRVEQAPPSTTTTIDYYTGSVHHIHNSGTAMPKDMLEYLINYQKFLWPNSPDFRLILFRTTDARTFLFYPFSTFRSVRQFLNFNFLPVGIFVQQIKRNFTCFHFRRYFAAQLNNLSA